MGTFAVRDDGHLGALVLVTIQRPTDYEDVGGGLPMRR
jgi:hypothetical protein